jgi:tetratricopeptide (TPR) repeat protein
MNSRLQSDFRITSSNWVAVGAFLVLLSSAPSALSQKVSVPRTPAQEQASLDLNSAAALYREGNFLEAQRHSERALEIDPENRSARDRRGPIHQRINDLTNTSVDVDNDGPGTYDPPLVCGMKL